MSDILDTLGNLFQARAADMERWFASKRETAPPLLTTSVDIRHSNFKLAPVDNNLYPAGFQNLSPKARRRAAAHVKSALELQAPDARRILIVPENHTRNLPYLDNLLVLREILRLAEFEVEIGSLTATDQPLLLQTAAGVEIVQQSLRKEHGKLVTDTGFSADAILLNNDCTSGWPELLKDISQPVFPSPHMGWWRRKKSQHFSAYSSLAHEFSQAFGVDEWLIAACFDYATGINFKTREGVDALASKAEAMLAKLAAKYQQYGINEKPFLYIKADSGTYGMGIMVIRSADELTEMNKKERNKMHVIKEGAEVHDVILQEGVPTADVIDGKAAEPMVYLVDGVPVGGMFRINGNRDATENLNAAGMEYHGMCDSDELADSTHHPVEGCDFTAYGIIATLSALASGMEANAAFSGRAMHKACA